MKKVLFVVFSAAISMTVSASNVTFDGNNMNLVSAANISNGSLQMVSKGGSGGAAWLITPVSTTKSFDVNYAFSLRSEGGGLMADGITFTLQNKGINNIGGFGGNLGYTNLNGVGSIIQTYYNNTAGLNIDGNAYHTKAANLQLGAANLVTGTEEVKYDALNHLLTMTGVLNVDGVHHDISDSKSIDLKGKFGDTVIMGLTGATGANYADERFSSFSVESISTAVPLEADAAVPEPGTCATLLAGLGLMGFMVRRRKTS